MRDADIATAAETRTDQAVEVMRLSCGSNQLPNAKLNPNHPLAETARRSSSCGLLTSAHWGTDERALHAPVALLSWLIWCLPVQPVSSERSVASEVTAKRLRLYNRDPETIATALALLRANPSPRGWWILEGQTYPDVFLETDDLVVVIEGKRTEPGPTTHTTWMRARHQMLRHPDAAWEIRGGRSLLGFFIVEAYDAVVQGEAPMLWRKAAEATYCDTAIAGSLPHRYPEEREGIVNAYLGVTTWQTVCDAFGIPGDRLIERVEASSDSPPH